MKTLLSLSRMCSIYKFQWNMLHRRFNKIFVFGENFNGEAVAQGLEVSDDMPILSK